MSHDLLVQMAYPPDLWSLLYTARGIIGSFEFTWHQQWNKKLFLNIAKAMTSEGNSANLEPPQRRFYFASRHYHRWCFKNVHWFVNDWSKGIDKITY